MKTNRHTSRADIPLTLPQLKGGRARCPHRAASRRPRGPVYQFRVGNHSEICFEFRISNFSIRVWNFQAHVHLPITVLSVVDRLSAAVERRAITCWWPVESPVISTDL
jgi:hypothetical protein